MMRYLLILLFLGWGLGLKAQDTFYMPRVELGEVLIRALPEDFDAATFIKIIKEDTSFYKAFKTMHLVTYHGEHKIDVFHPGKRDIIASYQSETKQIYRNGCRTMNVLEEQVMGDFYDKKGEYEYFTAKMYDQLFFTNGKVCNENNIVRGSLDKDIRGKNRIEKSKVQLKYLIFNPGVAIPGLPVIGKKAGIFEKDIAKDYDFFIDLVEIKGEWHYEFIAKPKAYAYNGMVIKYLRTWLRKGDLKIMGRDYHVGYKAGVYDFDVKMYVELEESRGKLLPKLIRYDGNWHVAMKKREVMKFLGKFYY